MYHNSLEVQQDYWATFVFYSSHIEEGVAASARQAQEQIHSLLQECDPGYAHGISVEMRAGDKFLPQNAPEDRRGYFVTEEDGTLKLVDRMTVYNLARSAYTVRASR